MKSSRNIITVFFLVIFLFPQFEKAIHDFHHLNDFHCDSTTHHFHGELHICTLCDFIIPDSPDTSKPISFFQLSAFTFYSDFFNTTIFFFAKYFFSLRAPPQNF